MKLNRKNLTHLPSKKDITKRWLLIDASDQVLGKLATRIAGILRGKGNPHFTPFMDTGDFVIVINARKIRLTGRKDEKKVYYRHSGYMGGIREISYQKMMQSYPERVIIQAVKGMLPKNRLGSKTLSKLKVYRDASHRHQAQKPEILKI